ncbi:PP2C family protein-serine/threonine phosphatase [Microbispora hainanensis]|uniref:PP2C family protein-serine/threonine phosphatase n=1 Tax=Microbispora hainanensis TaxID=568844 RepID=UPI00244DFE60|nr:PP2C family protein-serine/threonine phosphatase [Microbispora hainanensis]
MNRGHPPPLVLRRGRVACVLETPPDTPMGLRLGPTAVLARRRLEPGDRLLFYTDGIVEAQTPDGERFGLERFADFVIRREFDGVSAPESLRRLIQSILVYQRGRLQDDATVLLVEWRTGREHHRTT